MFAQIVSLGQTCACAHQINRFRLMSAARSRSLPPKRESFLFDWQITPLSAVVASVSADFAGLFEREDLIVRDGVVVHRRLDIQYPHHFATLEGVASEATIDEHFERVRARHDHLSRKMLSVVNSAGPVLYVVSGEPDTTASKLLEALGRHRGHRFHVAFFLTADIEIDLPGDGRLSRHEIVPARKPAATVWEGDDATWLRGFHSLIPRR